MLREVCFRTEHDTATVYLENDSASDNRIYTVYFDDLRMERLQAMDQTPLTITASSDTIFLGGVEASGEKALWLTYRNIGNRLVNTELSDRGEVLCAVPFTPTGESNTLWLPVTVDEDTSFCLTGLGKNVTLLSASLSELPLVRIRE